jgi:hypothetical protein
MDPEWEVCGVVTAHELAAFLVKAAAAVGRLDLTLGPEDRAFRDLAIGEMVEGMPMPRPLDGVREELLVGTDPVSALSHAFAQQASVCSEAAARATVAVVEEAVRHLYASGGEAAVADFLDGLVGRDEEPAA